MPELEQVADERIAWRTGSHPTLHGQQG
jgi:hypothetical protein